MEERKRKEKQKLKTENQPVLQTFTPPFSRTCVVACESMLTIDRREQSPCRTPPIPKPTPSLLNIAIVELHLGLVDQLRQAGSVVLHDRVARVLGVLVARQHRHARQRAHHVFFRDQSPRAVLEDWRVVSAGGCGPGGEDFAQARRRRLAVCRRLA